MCRFAVISALAFSLVHALAGRASADLIQYESLDLAVAGADLVLRGKVVDIASVKGDNGVTWNRVTVNVTETIKGEKLMKVEFLVREGPFESQGNAWRNREDEMLFCLNAVSNSGAPFKVAYALRSGWFAWAIPLSGTPATSLPIYSIEFKSLTSAKEILAAARAAAKETAGKAKTRLEWIVQAPELLKPHAVLYPDSERVRAAANKQQIKLLLLDQ